MISFVAEQRAHSARDRWSDLQTPEECEYRPLDPAAVANVGLEAGGPGERRSAGHAVEA
jgi:hypothetical protein